MLRSEPPMTQPAARLRVPRQCGASDHRFTATSDLVTPAMRSPYMTESGK